MKDWAFVALCLGSTLAIMIVSGYVRVASWQECRDSHGWAFCFTAGLR